jgi:hypothetical protein
MRTWLVRFLLLAWLVFQAWWCRQYIFANHWCNSVTLHSITSKKTADTETCPLYKRFKQKNMEKKSIFVKIHETHIICFLYMLVRWRRWWWKPNWFSWISFVSLSNTSWTCKTVHKVVALNIRRRSIRMLPVYHVAPTKQYVTTIFNVFFPNITNGCVRYEAICLLSSFLRILKRAMRFF